ncbi:alpha/beta hydrolase [Desulforhopalus sp. IMCC35007]|uniref:alpha/beta hydrolase n=1 Tax=Desulforhopalus sp. IMCC35007 TaxID=2569543 RepID=UPI00197B0359|nr:alpha/beta hydrolase [Desulforhopalus sp. IMCC35007]
MTTKSQAIYFLHGLESTGNGTKGRFFGENFPQIVRPDFTGPLTARLQSLTELCGNEDALTFIGSSYGGLMACCFAKANAKRVERLILLAPALNFEGYTPPAIPMEIPTLLLIGRHDDVTPPHPVLDLARKSFSNLSVWTSDDDHMLHNTFDRLNWHELLDGATDFLSLTPPPGIKTEKS